jgi:hypothetical protein
MSDLKVKVSGHQNLVRDVRSNAIINTSVSEYRTYLARVKSREKSSDELRKAVNEINTLKKDMREIKQLIKEFVGKE